VSCFIILAALAASATPALAATRSATTRWVTAPHAVQPASDRGGGAVDVGRVTGTVTVTGAPAGFRAVIGVEACPGAVTPPTTSQCQGARLAAVSRSGAYGMLLTAGTWTLVAGYDAGHGIVLGTPGGVAVVAGASATLALSIAYVAPPPPPGKVTGTVTITGAPAGFKTHMGVEACPGAVTPSTTSFCKGGRVVMASTAGYSLTLSAGAWTLLPGFAKGSKIVTGTPVAVTVVSGGTVTENLTVAYTPTPPPPPPPSTARVSGTITVTGAPSGFSAAYAVEACPDGETPSTADPCAGAKTTTSLTPSFTLTLPAGQWTLLAGYSTNGGSTIVGGTTVTLTLTVGESATQPLAIAYSAT
jgi:hypothetical protein